MPWAFPADAAQTPSPAATKRPPISNANEAWETAVYAFDLGRTHGHFKQPQRINRQGHSGEQQERGRGHGVEERRQHAQWN